MQEQAKRTVIVLSFLMIFAGNIFSQSVVSASAGLIHYTEGKVLINGKVLEPKFGNFPLLKNGDKFRTELGRAEILLAPGTFLRVGEDSNLRIISNKLLDARIELLAGSFVIEHIERLKNSVLALEHKNATIYLVKSGLYSFNADTALLKIYKGRASVGYERNVFTFGDEKQVDLSGANPIAKKLDKKERDGLLSWNRRRSEYLTMANLSAAKSIYDRRLPWPVSGWLWNPYFGMFTFVPCGRSFTNFFGYRYWSPRQVYVVFLPPQPEVNTAGIPNFRADLGYATVPQTSAGTSGTLSSSAPPTAASSSQTAPIPREPSKAGGRGR